MKIIAEIKGNKVLVEMDKDEIANVLGVYSRYNLDKMHENWNSIMNKDLKVSDIYTKHSKIRALQNEAEYSTARAKLKELLDVLTPIEDLATKLDLAIKEDGSNR